MKACFFLSLILATLIAACGIIQPTPGIVAGEVRGVTHYGATSLGPPIAGREITLLDSDTGNVAARTHTDAEGKFRFSVPPGKYSVWGGETAQYVIVNAGEITTLDITAPEK